MELTSVDDETATGEHHASELSIHDEAACSTSRLQLRGGARCDETTHLRVDTGSSTPEYRTFDSDDEASSRKAGELQVPANSGRVKLCSKRREKSSRFRATTALISSTFVHTVCSERSLCVI